MATRQDAQEVFARLLHESVVELFDACELSVERASAERAKCVSLGVRAVTTSIGAVAEGFRGVMRLALPTDLVDRSRPAMLRGGAPTEEQLMDWACELSNQLLGRIKNKLLRHGVTVQLALPTAAAADNLHLPSEQGGARGWQRYVVEGETFCASLAASFEPGFRLQEPLEDQDEAQAEGDTLLF